MRLGLGQIRTATCPVRGRALGNQHAPTAQRTGKSTAATSQKQTGEPTASKMAKNWKKQKEMERRIRANGGEKMTRYR